MSDQIITQVLTTSKQLLLNMGLIDTDNSYITVNDFQNKYAQSNDFFCYILTFEVLIKI